MFSFSALFPSLFLLKKRGRGFHLIKNNEEINLMQKLNENTVNHKYQSW